MLKQNQRYQRQSGRDHKVLQRIVAVANDKKPLRPGQIVVLDTKALQKCYEAAEFACDTSLDTHHDAALECLMRAEDESMLASFRKAERLVEPDAGDDDGGPGEEDGPWAEGWEKRSSTLGESVRPRRPITDTKSDVIRTKPKSAMKATSKKKQEKRLRQEIEYAVNYTDATIEGMDVLTAISARTQRVLKEMHSEIMQLALAKVKKLPDLRHRYYTGALAELQRQRDQAERFNRWADEKEAAQAKGK